MSSELVAGLLGGLLALVAGLATQAFGAWLTKRRRVRELAGRYLGALKSVGYVADRARAEHATGRGDSALLALQVQTEVISIGGELEMIGPRYLRTPVRGTVNGAIHVLSAHNSADPRTWAALRQALDQSIDDYNTAMNRLF